MKILVTRPSPAGSQLVEQLADVGLQAYHTPLITFSAGKDLARLPEQINTLSSGDLLLALSPRVIDYALPILQQHHFIWPDYLQYVAIGKTTATLLETICKHSVFYPAGAAISEELLQLPLLQSVAGKRALLLRGNGGRELIASTLQARGAEVIYSECYQRCTISYSGSEQSQQWQQQGIDTIIVTSGEMLQQLYTLVPDDQHHWLLSCRLIVVSERLATHARELGWNIVQVADNADNDALIRAIQTTY